MYKLRNKMIVYIIILLTVPITLSSQVINDDYDPRKSVIKIFSSVQTYNYVQPWQMRPVTNSSGSGFIIQGNMIMTNAHVVANSKYLQVKKFGDPKLYTARVKIIGDECDLALVTVDDTRFFDNTQPFLFGELPAVMDEVVILGYPIGGDELNITRGIVSRVEHINYAYSSFSFLGCQLDASINSGNSGGPVLSGKKVVGVAFQGLTSQDLSYMISPPIIQHFLKDIEDGTFDGFTDLMIKTENMVNDDIREFYKMPENESGILVFGLYPNSLAKDYIKPGDIITAIDGVTIADDGTVEFRPGERTIWGYLVDNKYIDENAKVSIIRNGKQMNLDIPMIKPKDLNLVAYNQSDKEPKFFVLGGFVFQTLSLNYLYEYGKYWRFDAPQKLMYQYRYGEITDDRKEVIFISDILPDDLNNGYKDLVYDFIISKINGKKAASLEDLISIVETTKDKFIEIEEEDGEKIIMNTSKVRAANEDILIKYKVTKDRSEIYQK